MSAKKMTTIEIIRGLADVNAHDPDERQLFVLTEIAVAMLEMKEELTGIRYALTALVEK